MRTTTTRTGDEGQNFQQMTTGETPNSVSVSTNAKGQAQVDIKLYFATPDDAVREADVYIGKILKELRRTLGECGVLMAGQEGK